MSKKKRILRLIEGNRKQKTLTCPICKTCFDISDEYDLDKARRCLTVCSTLEYDSLPKFARFKHDPKATTVFRLSKIDYNNQWCDWGGGSSKKEIHLTYSVDNGAWSVIPYMKNGKIYSKHSYDHLNDKELVATTKQKYLDATGEYACKSISDPNYERELINSYTDDDIPY